MKIPELTERINKINALLDDPHPGLGTWCAFLGERMSELIAAWQGEPAPTAEQEADGDWLDRILPVEPKRADIANVLSIVRDIGKGYGLFQELNEGVVWHICRNYTSICRARLTASQKPDPAVEAVIEASYIPADTGMTQDPERWLKVCNLCGALVYFDERHTRWHAALNKADKGERHE